MDRFSWERAVRDDPSVTGTRMLVLLTLATYMDAKGQGAFPSQATLATATGVSERTLRRHLSDAVRAGWLTLDQRGHGRWQGGPVSNAYSVRTPSQPATSGRKQEAIPPHNRPPVAGSSGDSGPATGHVRPEAEEADTATGHPWPEEAPPDPASSEADGPTTGHPESYNRPELCPPTTGPPPHTSSSPVTYAGGTARRQLPKIEPMDSPYQSDPLKDPEVVAWRKRHAIPNNTHQPSKPWDLFKLMGERELERLWAEGKRADLPIRELPHACEAWVRGAASNFKRQHGGRLNDLLTDNPGRHPDWYVYALDRRLAEHDWSVKSARDRVLYAVSEAS